MTDEHARARELAAVALDFELDPAERRELDRHLATCDSCRAHAAALRSNAAALSSLPQVDAPKRVRQAVLAGRPAGAGSARALALAMSLVVLALVPLGVAVLYGGLGGPGAGAGGLPIVTPAVAIPTPSPSPRPSPSIGPEPNAVP